MFYPNHCAYRLSALYLQSWSFINARPPRRYRVKTLFRFRLGNLVSLENLLNSVVRFISFSRGVSAITVEWFDHGVNDVVTINCANTGTFYLTIKIKHSSLFLLDSSFHKFLFEFIKTSLNWCPYRNYWIIRKR